MCVCVCVCVCVCLQGILFCTSECLKSSMDLLKVYLHESSRVYRDKLTDEQDIQAFNKLQTDTAKKLYEVSPPQKNQTFPSFLVLYQVHPIGARLKGYAGGDGV